MWLDFDVRDNSRCTFSLRKSYYTNESCVLTSSSLTRAFLTSVSPCCCVPNESRHPNPKIKRCDWLSLWWCHSTQLILLNETLALEETGKKYWNTIKRNSIKSIEIVLKILKQYQMYLNSIKSNEIVSSTEIVSKVLKYQK